MIQDTYCSADKGSGMFLPPKVVKKDRHSVGFMANGSDKDCVGQAFWQRLHVSEHGFSRISCIYSQDLSIK